MIGFGAGGCTKKRDKFGLRCLGGVWQAVLHEENGCNFWRKVPLRMPRSINHTDAGRAGEPWESHRKTVKPEVGTGAVRVVSNSLPATKRVAVGDDISRCAGKKGRLFGRGARAGATGATDWTAGTTLPAPLAVTGSPFWPSGVLALHTECRMKYEEWRNRSIRHQSHP